jgi:hypothetical protein
MSDTVKFIFSNDRGEGSNKLDFSSEFSLTIWSISLNFPFYNIKCPIYKINVYLSIK